MRLQTNHIAAKMVIPWIFLLIIVGTMTVIRLHQYQTSNTREQYGIINREMAVVAQDIRYLSQERWNAVLLYQQTREIIYLNNFYQSLEQTDKKIDRLRELTANPLLGNRLFPQSMNLQLLNSYELAREGRRDLYLQFIASIEEGDAVRQALLMTILLDKYKIIRASLEDLTVYSIKRNALSEQQRIHANRTANALFFSFLLMVIVLGMILSTIQTVTISVPLKELATTANMIANGEDAVFTQKNRRDEIGDLSKAFISMVTALKDASKREQIQHRELESAYSGIERQIQLRTKELLQRTWELEASNKDLESFSYSVSHDLRAPLRAIDGFISILLEDYSEKLDEEGIRLFTIVSDNARKMGMLIDDILTFSRAGRSSLTLDMIDMNQLVAEVWKSLKEDRTNRKISFQKDLLPTLLCDHIAMRQVWQNLLTNALKFTREQTHAKILIKNWEDEKNYFFSISDNGVGFDPLYKDKLFILFQRLHSFDEFEGTGVGLALVKRYLHKHHGDIEATATLHKGANFTFYIPKDQNQED